MSHQLTPEQYHKLANLINRVAAADAFKNGVLQGIRLSYKDKLHENTLAAIDRALATEADTVNLTDLILNILKGENEPAP